MAFLDNINCFFNIKKIRRIQEPCQNQNLPLIYFGFFYYFWELRFTIEFFQPAKEVPYILIC